MMRARGQRARRKRVRLKRESQEEGSIVDSKEKYKGAAKRRPRGSMKNKWRTYNEPKVDICHYSCLVILHVPDEEKKF